MTKRQIKRRMYLSLAQRVETDAYALGTVYLFHDGDDVSEEDVKRIHESAREVASTLRHWGGERVKDPSCKKLQTAKARNEKQLTLGFERFMQINSDQPNINAIFRKTKAPTEPLAKSILDHKHWMLLKPYFRLQTYDRDGGHSHPRHRIEFACSNPTIIETALKVRIACASCGLAIQPIRSRAPSKRGIAEHYYYAAACPLNVNIGCSRGNAAKMEYENIIQALQTPTPGMLYPELGGEPDQTR